MIKQSIRLVGCIIALFALILVFKHSHLMQEEKPLNTTERFNIAVLSTTISKERLVNELNALVDQYGAVLVKVVPNQDNYDSQKDIIWFGSLQPDGTSPRIRDNRISWLEPSVGGELIHSSDMGVRPLYGSYSMLGSTEFKVALAEWCNKNEMSIDFYKQYPLPAVFLVYFIQHGIGNAVLISFFLFLTTVIVWFVTHAKARALRLLGGVPLQRIHFEDTLTIISLTSQGFFVGCAAFFIYLGIAFNVSLKKFGNNQGQIKEVLEIVGLQGREKDKALVLSGGEKQRLGIARAILKNASVIFADEPTASLDNSNRQLVVSLLKDCANRGAAIILATHDERLVAECDTVVRLGT